MAEETQESPYLLKDEAGIVYRAPDRAAALEAMRNDGGLKPATEEDADYYRTHVKHLQPSEKGKALASGLASMATGGLSDRAIEHYAPGYTKEVDEHNAFARAMGEFVPLVAGAVATGGGALAARGAAMGAASTAGRLAKGLKAGATYSNPVMAGAKAGAKIAANLEARGASKKVQFLGRAVGDEIVTGTLLGTQQGFKQSAIEGADWERALVLGATGFGLGGATGIATGGLRYKLGARSIAGGLQAKGVPAGTAAAMGDDLAAAGGVGPSLVAEEAVRRGAVAPDLADFAKASKRVESAQGTKAAWDTVRDRGAVAGKELHRQLDESLDPMYRASRDVDLASREVVKPHLVRAYAENIKVTDPVAEQYLASAEAVRTTLLDIISPYASVTKKGSLAWKKGAEGGLRKQKQFRDNISRTVKELAPEELRRAIDREGGTRGLTMVLDDAKRRLFDAKAANSYGKGPGGAAVVKVADGTYEELRQLLENPAFVGKNFAKFQKNYNAGTWQIAHKGSPWRSTLNKLAKLKERTGDRPWENLTGVRSSAVENYVKSIGSTAGEEATSDLSQAMQSQRLRAKAIIELAEEGGADAAKALSGKTFQGSATWETLVASARETLKTTDRVLELLNLESKTTPYNSVLSAHLLTEAGKLDRAPLLSGNLLGIVPVGAALRGAVGAVRGLPQGIGASFREAAASASGLVDQPVKVLATTGDIYNAMVSKRTAVEKGLGSFFKGTVKAPGTALRPRGQVTRNFTYAGQYLTAAQVRYEKELDRLQQDNANPEAAEDRVLEALDGLGNSGADYRIGAVEKANQIRKYLLRIAPTESMNTFILGRRRPVSKAESERFNRVHKILMEPQTMIKRMEENRLSVDEVKAVREIYPEWYKEIQLSTMGRCMEMAEKGKTLPYAKRLQLWRCLGIPTDPTMDTKFTRYMVMEYAKAKKKQPKPPPQSQKKSRLAQSYESGSQKAEEGVGPR